MAKNIKFEFCVMNLEKKAEWHKDINGGFVPMFEDTKGNTFIESADIMEKINDEYLS
jgi:glutathione S-transferase